MAETREGTSATSSALERLRSSQPVGSATSDAPRAPGSTADAHALPPEAPRPTAPAKNAPRQGKSAQDKPARPTTPPTPSRPPAARHMGTGRPAVDASGSPKRLSDWFDNLHQPDWAATRVQLSDAMGRRRAAAAERSRERAAARRVRERARAAQEAADRAAAAERAETKRLEAERAAAERAREELLKREEAERAASAAQHATLVERARQAIETSHTLPQSPIDDLLEEEELPDRQPVWVEEPDEEPIYIPPYNLPSTDPDPAENRQDAYRRVAVSVAAALTLFLGFPALGWFGGTTVHATPDSPFHPDVALLSIEVDSFALWGVVFLALGAFAAYQWHPTQRSSPRQRSLGYVAGGAGVLGALWLLAARNGMVSTSLWISIVTTGLLVYGLRMLNLRTARSRTERILVDAPVGLYLGWMLVVAPMNLGVWLTSRGIDVLLPESLWGVVALLGATWAAVSFCMSERGRIVVAIGFAWGLFWLMMARLIGQNESAAVAIMAGLCAFITLLATENRRYQIGHAERRAARGQRTEF